LRSAQARQFAQSLVDQPDFGKFGAFVPAEDAPTTGGLMFANYIAGALLQDAAVNQAKDVPAGTKAEPKGEDLNDPNSAGKDRRVLRRHDRNHHLHAQR
jgi:hypothetical protein